MPEHPVFRKRGASVADGDLHGIRGVEARSAGDRVVVPELEVPDGAGDHHTQGPAIQTTSRSKTTLNPRPMGVVLGSLVTGVTDGRATWGEGARMRGAHGALCASDLPRHGSGSPKWESGSPPDRIEACRPNRGCPRGHRHSAHRQLQSCR